MSLRKRIKKNIKQNIEQQEYPKIKKVKRSKIHVPKILGPGFVTGSSDNDPSGIGTYSIAGAKYGLLLAWLLPFLYPLMYVIQEMCARIGLVTGKGLTANMKSVFPRPVIYLAVALLLLANIFNIGANVAIMAESANLIVPINVDLLAIFIVVITIIMEIFISYHVYSKILVFLTTFLLAYIITAFMVSQNWLEVVQYVFIPHIQWNRDFIITLTGFIGTTISPYLFFWQTSQEVEERMDHEDGDFSKRHTTKLITSMKKDTLGGMFFSQLIALFIVITCYSSLHQNGITEIASAHDAALALKPFAGEWAFLVFTIGIIGAGFLAIPILAGSAAYAFSEAFGRIEGLSCKLRDALFFYGIITFSMVIGLLLHFLKINPINSLLYAAVINGIVAVPLIAFVIVLANKKEVMQKHKNGLFSNVVGWFTFGIMLVSAVLTIGFIVF